MAGVLGIYVSPPPPRRVSWSLGGHASLSTWNTSGSHCRRHLKRKDRPRQYHVSATPVSREEGFSLSPH